MKNYSGLGEKCCFQFCYHNPSNQNSESLAYQNELKLPFKKEKISLKRRTQINYFTQRNQKAQDKKIWEQRTRTGTEKFSNLLASNRMSSRNQFPITTGQSISARNNIIIPNYSTRTFEIPTQSVKTQLQSIPQYGKNLKCLTQRNMIQNIRSQPFFPRQNSNAKKIEKSPIISKREYGSSRQSLKKEQNQQTGDFQNEYETVNSILSGSIIEERISESTIEIDFFNPSQTRLWNLENGVSTKKILPNKK